MWSSRGQEMGQKMEADCSGEVTLARLRAVCNCSGLVVTKNKI